MDVAKPNEADLNFGLRVGDYVKVIDEGNPVWKEFGIGCIRREGKQLGTLDVQFDSGGDTWCMQASMLKKCCAPERKFRALGETIAPESTAGREHKREVQTSVGCKGWESVC